jgi:hypothetical protein
MCLQFNVACIQFQTYTQANLAEYGFVFGPCSVSLRAAYSAPHALARDLQHSGYSQRLCIPITAHQEGNLPEHSIFI